MRRAAAVALIAAAAFARGRAQQPPQPARVDFVRDVQPIFRQHCYSCHGPAIHQAGLRLDRRSDAMRGGTIAVIGPGTSEASRLYLRVAGMRGSRMPPTAALSEAQIAIIRDWIDQGAVWPDEAAGDAPPRPTPPVMRAVLDEDLDAVRRLLDGGADPNARSAAGATALMWAAGDEAKARLLLDRGADVNAASDDGRTALMVAAGLQGNAPVVRLLLDHGANVAAGANGASALVDAAYTGDEPIVRLLLAAGAPVDQIGGVAVALALQRESVACAELIAAKLPPKAIEQAVEFLLPPNGDAHNVPFMFAHGIDPALRSPKGQTLLIGVAASDAVPPSVVAKMIERGADVRATFEDGVTALSRARLHGDTAVVSVLRKAGAEERPSSVADATRPPPPSPTSSARAAVVRSLPLLQRNDVSFLKKSGCVSCHNNSLAAMAVAEARAHGITVDESIARSQTESVARYIAGWRERALVGLGIPGDHDSISYILLGLAAERYPADENTAAMARFLARMQDANGQWHIIAHRPPIESNDIEVTAASMRALQAYAPKGDARSRAAIERAAAWLLTARPKTTEERAFHLLGLRWSGAARPAITAAAGGLVAEQRSDGGWGQLPSLSSDAYATGQALVALGNSGAVGAGDAVYARGVRFLVRTQLADGSWFVKTRALPVQPYFESGFPHGANQFISAAATAWATQALARAH